MFCQSLLLLAASAASLALNDQPAAARQHGGTAVPQLQRASWISLKEERAENEDAVSITPSSSNGGGGGSGRANGDHDATNGNGVSSRSSTPGSAAPASLLAGGASSSSSSGTVGFTAQEEADDVHHRERRQCNANTCMTNQGQCIRHSDGESRCECLAGYQGERCALLYCESNCTMNGICVPNGDYYPVCQCYEGYTGDTCSLVPDFDGSTVQTESALAKSKTTVLISIFLAALLIFTFLLVASWHKNGKTTIIHPPAVPEGRELGPLVSRVTLTTTRFMWCSSIDEQREDFFDNGTGPSRVPMVSRIGSVTGVVPVDPELPPYVPGTPPANRHAGGRGQRRRAGSAPTVLDLFSSSSVRAVNAAAAIAAATARRNSSASHRSTASSSAANPAEDGEGGGGSSVGGGGGGNDSRSEPPEYDPPAYSSAPASPLPGAVPPDDGAREGGVGDASAGDGSSARSVENGGRRGASGDGDVRDAAQHQQERQQEPAPPRHDPFARPSPMVSLPAVPRSRRAQLQSLASAASASSSGSDTDGGQPHSGEQEQQAARRGSARSSAREIRPSSSSASDQQQQQQSSAPVRHPTASPPYTRRNSTPWRPLRTSSRRVAPSDSVDARPPTQLQPQPHPQPMQPVYAPAYGLTTAYANAPLPSQPPQIHLQPQPQPQHQPQPRLPPPPPHGQVLRRHSADTLTRPGVLPPPPPPQSISSPHQQQHYHHGPPPPPPPPPHTSSPHPRHQRPHRRSLSHPQQLHQLHQHHPQPMPQLPHTSTQYQQQYWSAEWDAHSRAVSAWETQQQQSQQHQHHHHQHHQQRLLPPPPRHAVDQLQPAPRQPRSPAMQPAIAATDGDDAVTMVQPVGGDDSQEDDDDDHSVPSLTPISLATHNRRARTYSASDASVTSYTDAIIADLDDGPRHESQSRRVSTHAPGTDPNAPAAARTDNGGSGGGGDSGAWTHEESESLMLMMLDAHNDIVADAGPESHYSSPPLSMEELSSLPAPPSPSPSPSLSTLPAEAQQHGNQVSDDLHIEEWEEVPAEIRRQWDVEAKAELHRQADTANTPTPASPRKPSGVTVDSTVALLQLANMKQRERKEAAAAADVAPQAHNNTRVEAVV